MSEKKVAKPVALAVGAALAGSFAVAGVANADMSASPFAMTTLSAGYMLATPMILFESPFSRVMDRFFPWMNVIGSEGPRAILDTIAISDALVAAFALVLYFRDRKNGAPWLMAAAFVLLQAVVMWFAPDMPFLNDAFGAYGRIPPTVTLAAGALAGIAVTYFGWVAGSRPKAKPVATTAG